jgi:hypothetical protein
LKGRPPAGDTAKGRVQLADSGNVCRCAPRAVAARSVPVACRRPHREQWQLGVANHPHGRGGHDVAAGTCRRSQASPRCCCLCRRAAAGRLLRTPAPRCCCGPTTPWSGRAGSQRRCATRGTTSALHCTIQHLPSRDGCGARPHGGWRAGAGGHRGTHLLTTRAAAAAAAAAAMLRLSCVGSPSERGLRGGGAYAGCQCQPQHAAGGSGGATGSSCQRTGGWGRQRAPSIRAVAAHLAILVRVQSRRGWSRRLLQQLGPGWRHDG